MEQFVLGVFQEQLSKFIIGFRKEQVNANLLNGKGEIRDVELNCSVLNENLSKMTPFVELEAVHVSKLSFHVSSWTNIRKAPILVHVEHVTATVKEPLHYVDRAKRRRLRQVTRGELVEMIRAGIIKARGAYNLFDRILDNLTIEVASVSIKFQPWGRFKTRRIGPWTPPEIQLDFAGIYLVSVNEYGQEAPPEEVWRHNHHRSASGSLLIYKKLSMEYKISIRPANESKPIPLVTGRDNKLEVHLAMKRRIRDGEWLAVQIDTTIPHVEVNLPQEVIPHLVHALAGISYCVAKDRGFEDPLKPTSQTDHDQASVHVPMVKLASSMDDVAEEEGGEDTSAIDVPVQIEENEESSDEEELTSGANAPAATADSAATKAATGRYALPDDIQNQPIILLPNGLTISEQLSLSLSVYDFKLRGMYAEQGHFEVISKGCIGEAIWPKTSKQKGGYVQASVSYVTVQEKYKEKLSALLSGGAKFDTASPVESPGKPSPERGRDETFPLYEDRVIRPDPLGLRYTFPAQAFGLKSTVEFVKKLTKEPKMSDNEEIQVLHETGMDNFDIVLDANPWSRILRFLANEKGGGFDPRWSSGDWSKDLNASMLVRPSSRLNLEECLQPARQIFLDENQFISSDLFNVTCRMTEIRVRIPAAIEESLTASDIIFAMNEGMVVVSSALPRTMLSGRIGTSVNGDNVEAKGVINFPNDPSDVSYQLERSEDPGDRQRGIVTSRSISTFRVQFTIRGGFVQIVPVVQFYAAKQPQEFLAPTDATMIFCFEGEPPESEESNLTKIVLFTSLVAHRILINFDVELVASALTSLLTHYRSIEDCVRQITETLAESFVDESDTETSFSDTGDEVKLLKSIHGRRLLVRRQMIRSRETGGLSAAIGIQMAELSFHLWRQCIPISSPLRPSFKDESTDSYIPVLRVMHFFLGELELGVEASFIKHSRRIVFKGCLSQASTAVCNLSEEIDRFKNAGKLQTQGRGPEEAQLELSELFSIGEDHQDAVRNPLDYSAAFRLEENLQKSRCWSFSADLCEASRLTFRPEELESLATLMFEAFMQPNQSNTSQEEAEEERVVVPIFPRNTIGGLFLSLVSEKLLPANFLSLLEESGPTKPEAIPVKSFDKILRKALNRIPNDVHVVLIRYRVQDFSMFVPRDPKGDADICGGLCFGLHSLDFLAQFLRSECSMEKSQIFNVIARKDSTWADIVKREDGLIHEMTSEQSLSAVSDQTGKNNRPLIGDIVVPKFTSGYSYADSRFLLEIPSGVAVDGVEHLERFLFCMLSFRDRCKQMISSMSNLLQALRTLPSRQKVDEDAVSPVVLACARTTSSLHSVLNILDKITRSLMQYDIHLARLLDEKDQALSTARLVSFMREKERLAAHAIVSAQKTGWLRIGVASKSGQRGTFTASLWPYWCILRKGIIISYNGPGDLRPLTMISLEGATLMQLGGGNRKKDLRRAFGLVEFSGAMHILIACSDSDYFGWIHEMKRSVSSLGDFSGQKDNAVWGGEDTYSDSNERQSDDDGGSSGQPQQRLFGRTISKAVQVAKASKQAVVERRLRRGGEAGDALEANTTIEPTAGDELQSAGVDQLGEEINSVASTDVLEDTASRRQQLRSRFAGMGQVTKRGLGSAVQIARQKSRQVAERRRMRQHNEMDEAPSITLSESEIQSSEPNLWDCLACTFSNRGEALACEMCSTLREPDQPTELTQTIESDEASLTRTRDAGTTESEEFSDSNQRVGIRLRLGNAVRNVRQNNADTVLEPGRAGMKFGFRRRASQTNVAQHDGAPEPVTIKQVTMNGPLRDHTHPFGYEYFEGAVVQQKRFDQVWFVRVKVMHSHPAHSEVASDSNYLSLKAITSKVADSKMLQTTENVPGDTTTPLDNHASGSIGTEVSDEPIAEPSHSLHSEAMAFIEVFQQIEGPGWINRPVSSITVSLSAIFALHAEISECVGRLPPPSSFQDIKPRSQAGSPTRSLAVALGLTTLDTVRITGTLLSGLLQYHPDSGEYSLKAVSEYQGEVIAEFFNAMFDSELPIDALAMMTDFLEISDASTRNIDADESKSEKDSSALFKSGSTTTQARHIFELSKLCRTALLRAQGFSSTAEKIAHSFAAEEARVQKEPSELAVVEPLVPPAFSQRLQESMHAALLKVMEERDISHARLAAAEVMHVHQLEQQRKQNSRLNAELEASRSESTAQNVDRERQQRHFQMQQSSDEELMSLCQQLAGEISARTAAALEVTRLKEGHRMKSEQHKDEVQALKDEIVRLRAELDKEKAKALSVSTE